jgi:outer membrane protein TolC
MNLSWSVLALALIGAQGQQPSQPKTPSSPIIIEFDITGPAMVGSESCRNAGTAIAVEPDVCSATKSAQKAGAVAKLVDFCIERCVDLIVDEAKAAIVAKLTESPGSATKLATCTTGAFSAPPKGLPAATLPMQLPKVAKPRTHTDPEGAEDWPMTLQEAYRIALDNSEIVRVIAFGAQGIPIGGVEPTPLKAWTPPNEDTANSSSLVIARLNADATFFRFKAEIMAQVRSVEQVYWSLAQAHVQLWAADRAVSLAQEVLDREQSELTIGRGTVADVAEAAQRLEQFNLDLVTRTSDVITTERQLRNLLGLPPADNRRIIPVTPPTEQLIEYDWDTCLGEMMDEQPDIVQQQLTVRIAEMKLLIARNQLIPPLDLDTLLQLNGLTQRLDPQVAAVTKAMLKVLNPLISDREQATGLYANPGDANGFPNWQTGFFYPQLVVLSRGPLPNSRQCQYILLRSRAYLKQIEHQTTHSLARFFLEVDANYKQFKTSSRLRVAAAQRLDAQRANYEEGRITIDRFLDAVSQYATAVATEAQYKSTYNVSLAALAEAKGTLLAERNIVIAEGPHPRKAYIHAARRQGPVPLAVPAMAAIPEPAAMRVPGQWAAIAHPFKWKGTQDLMTVAAAFSPEMPQALEVPRVGAFIMPPVLSVNDATCRGTKPEATSTMATKRDTSGTSAKCDSACTLTKADDASTAVKTNAPAKAKTWTFSISIGGTNPLQIKGTITEGETERPAAVGR